MLNRAALEGVSVLRPVGIRVKGDFSVFLPFFSLNDGSEVLSKAFEDFGK
jgi:hypothetical protein